MYFMVAWVVIFSFHPRRAPQCGESALPLAQFWRRLSPFRINTYGQPASVDSKAFTASLGPLSATLTKNRGDPSFKPKVFSLLEPFPNGPSNLPTFFLSDLISATPSESPLCFGECCWYLSTFRMNTSKSVSKQRTLTTFRMNTYEKQGEGYAVIVNQKCLPLSFRRFTTSHAQLSHQPRNNHLPENHRIRPHFHLPSQMPALRIDPRLLRHVPVAQDQVRVGYRYLRIQGSRYDQHRRGWFSEELLLHQGQLGKPGNHVIDVVDPFDDGHKRWRMVKQVLPVPKHGVQHVFLLKKEMRRRGLRAHGLQACPLHDAQLGSPVTAPTHALTHTPHLIHFGPGLQIIQHARKHAICCRAYFDRRLAGSRAVDSEKPDAVRQDGAKVFREIFLAAVQAADRQHQRHWALRTLRQPHVADNLGAFKWDANNLQRRVPQKRVEPAPPHRYRLCPLLYCWCPAPAARAPH